MRLLFLALPLFLTACASDPAPPPTDAPASEAGATTPTSTAGATTDTAFLLGTWQELGRKRTLDGALRESSGVITWTFREDGSAFHAQTYESMGALTEDYTWTLDGANLVLSNAATGDARWNFEIVARGDDTLTLFAADRNEHYVLERA